MVRDIYDLLDLDLLSAFHELILYIMSFTIVNIFLLVIYLQYREMYNWDTHAHSKYESNSQ